MNLVNAANLRLERGWLSQDGAAHVGPVPKALILRLISSSMGLIARQAAVPIPSAQSIPSGICRLQLAGECAVFSGLMKAPQPLLIADQ